MIVPRPSLILLGGVTLIPLLGLAISFPFWAAPLYACLGLVVGVATMDAILGKRKISLLSVELPEKVRWVEGREALLTLFFQIKQPQAFLVRFGLALPPELKTRQEATFAELPAEEGRHQVDLPCLAQQRGLYRIAGCYFEITSPLKLWDIRGSQTKPVKVQVYPSMENERSQVAALFLRTSQSGMKAFRQVGQGRDFEKLREYVPGDGYETIHWKATARRGHPITKVYQVEKTQEVYVMLDASRLSGRLLDPNHPEKGTHLDRYIAATLLLGLAAEKQGDLFGLLAFNDRVLNFVRARNGKEHYSACREALYQLTPQTVSPDFEEVASFIRMRLRRRALLVFMTDLDDPILMESFQKAAHLICRKHLILVQMLQPGQVRPIFSNIDLKNPEEIYHDLAGHLAWHDLRQLVLSLQQHGVSLSLLPKERFSTDIVSNYFRIKQRQLL